MKRPLPVAAVTAVLLLLTGCGTDPQERPAEKRDATVGISQFVDNLALSTTRDGAAKL